MKIPRSSRGLVIISPRNRLDEISRYSQKSNAITIQSKYNQHLWNTTKLLY